MNFFGQSSALAPAGPHAHLAANVWWILFGLCATVYVSVVVVLLASVFLKKGEPSHRRQRLAVGLAGGATIVILLAILGASVRAGHGMHPPPSEAGLTVKVIAHQWWWEIIYPGSPANQTVFTANELHIPVRTKVLVQLTSRDVIHSFWVPALHGKRDLIPGHDSTTFLEADQPGIYHGQCAEFCGVAHANMAFQVHAEPPDVFQRWLDQQRKPAAAPVSQSALQGQQLFMRTTCPGCHTITGTDAGG
ncbi:MAG TPA: cytochrome c oxidase subunit II, partial [Polyangia bacterium]|nr:cytochrome c oxidase subunit II [Polyangia bacterium]